MADTAQIGPAPCPSNADTVEARELATWHSGELDLQARAGVLDRMADVGPRVIRTHLTKQHRDFYPLLPFVVLGSVDQQGDAWATLRAGRPGFLKSTDEHHLTVHSGRDWSDPSEAGLSDGDVIGLLGIELPTRRRNRLNGLISRRAADGFTIAVEQAYGNCPKYIQSRQPAFVRDPDADQAVDVMTSTRLDQRARALIEVADTFFVATYIGADREARQVDVSHRGGKPGFVRIEHDGSLTIPDFAGNRFFNTLGNILLNPRVGLVFVDFATGDLLQITGKGEIDGTSEDIGLYQGAERLWRVHPENVVYRRDALPLRFSTDQAGLSPHLRDTGDWRSPVGGATAGVGAP